MTSSIEWLMNPDGSEGETWNPVVGCSRVSPGCDNCYAMGVAHRNLSEQHRGLTKLRPKNASRPGVDWTGEVRTVHKALRLPLRWRKTRRVFVNSMSDLFHPGVPDHFIDSVFAVMLITSLHESRGGHTYLLLTKRPERALAYLTAPDLAERIAREAGQMMEDGDGWHDTIWSHVREHGPTHERIQLGVSAEDQATWDERVPVLLQCPAAVRWVSVEPQLGLIDPCHHLVALDWIVVGGESGPRARPFDVGWARAIVEECCDAKVPVFVKQLGARPMTRANRPDEMHGRAVNGPDLEWPLGTRFTTAPGHMGTHWQGRWARLKDRKGKDMAEWPPDLRVRQYPTPRTHEAIDAVRR